MIFEHEPVLLAEEPRRAAERIVSSWSKPWESVYHKRNTKIKQVELKWEIR
jgi:hypothetical protein